MAMIYKFPACLQRIWKLHFANHFYRKSAMNDFQCIRYFSSTKKYYWESTDEQKTRNWKQIRKETYFMLQVIMRTSQHLKEISSLKSICLVISRFTNMWFHFFFTRQVHHLSHTWKGNSNKEILHVHYLAQLFARCEWGFVLASLYALM